jgi:hypothetical protein
MMDEKVAPFAPVIIRLLQGIIYTDSKEWNLLHHYENPIREYLAQIGMELYFAQEKGFAYILQQEAEDKQSALAKLPRLTRRIKLSYAVTILAVLLREKLLQHEQKASFEPLGVSRDDIVEMVKIFLRDNPNEKRVAEQIDQHIAKLVEVEFLQESKKYAGRFEVRPILAAKIDSEILVEIKTKLQAVKEAVNDDE